MYCRSGALVLDQLPLLAPCKCHFFAADTERSKSHQTTTTDDFSRKPSVQTFLKNGKLYTWGNAVFSNSRFPLRPFRYSSRLYTSYRLGPQSGVVASLWFWQCHILEYSKELMVLVSWTVRILRRSKQTRASSHLGKWSSFISYQSFEYLP